MALTKKSLNNFLPNGFETQNKEGYKANFTNDRILSGYEKDTLEILSGPNLNNFIDKTGKNFNTLNDLLEYFNEMPIDSFPIVNASNQLDYKSINSFFRNVGELVFSSVPIDDKNLHLADGSLLDGKGTYRVFVDFIGKMATKYPNLFTDEATWQATVSKYGTCGKYVWNAENKTLRLPRLKGIVEATIDQNSIGNITEAGLPNITGTFCADNTQVGNTKEGGSHAPTGSFFKQANITNYDLKSDGGRQNGGTMGFDASRSSQVYGKSNTVQPQTVKQYIYIVVSVDTEETTKLTSVFQYRGSVPTFADLPTEGNITGDVWNVYETDVNYVWDGAEWDQLSGSVDLTGYYTKEQADTRFATVTSLESNVENLQSKITQNTTDIASLGLGSMVASSLEKGKALKYLETKGNITEDADVYNDVYNYKHSSFDINKFTVVGSLTITEDGIASGFSKGNCVQIGKSFELGANWDIETAFIMNSYSTEQNTIVTGKDIRSLSFGVWIDGKINFNCGDGTSWILGDKKGVTVIPLNKEVKAKLSCRNGVYTSYLDIGNGYQQEATTTNTSLVIPAIDFYIGTNLWNTTNNFLVGSIDLKQFSITVDGKEVFNGNKTGLDVIKPDNYTVAGSPTISDDGVVGNIGRETGHIQFKINPSYLKDKSWVIETPTYIRPAQQPYESYLILFGTVGDSQFGAISFYKGFLGCRGYTGDEKLLGGATMSGISIGVDFSTLQAKWEFNNNNGEYKIYYSIDGSDWVLAGSKIPTSENKQLTEIIKSNRPLLLHNYYYNPDDNFDLNTFKIYVDGELVYQPCLKIPYNISKTGLKVANADARERVIGMGEDYGYSQYFTIDEENKNATLPIGAGITGRQDLIASFDDGANKYEQFSDLTFKQSGKCTANTAVTFIQPYKDDTYKLSVPYSAKTKTGFTPTVSGDWFAEGKIYLD